MVRRMEHCKVIYNNFSMVLPEKGGYYWYVSVERSEKSEDKRGLKEWAPLFSSALST